MWIWLIVIAAVVGLDQATKHLVMNFLDRNEPFVVIKGVFRFSYVENDGAAFGSFGDQRWIFMVVSIIGIIGLLIYLWKFRPESKFACSAIAMIIGGGIGNMIDRCFYKGTLPWTEGKNVVIDFIDFYAFPEVWPWVFNVADSFVCIGAGMLMVWCVWSLIKEMKIEKAKKLAEATENETEEEEKQD